MNFSLFKQAVSRQFANMSQFPLYAVDIEGDVLWDTYLRAFPEGTNPIYRERTEHDCTCCRQFIKNAGKIVAIIGDEVVSIWDIVPHRHRLRHRRQSTVGSRPQPAHRRAKGPSACGRSRLSAGLGAVPPEPTFNGERNERNDLEERTRH